MPGIQPTPYQQEIRDYLKSQEAGLWAWFSSQKFLAEYADNVRIEILKGAYRLDRGTHAALYAQADDVLKKLGLAIPMTMYQSQLDTRLNACLSYLPGEAHLIFSGPVFTTLAPDELSSIIGHELNHYLLYESEGGEFLVVDQILSAMAGDRRAEASHIESCRLNRLYMEIFADRGSLAAIPDPLTAISALIKLATGLKEVNAQSYLAQADEILSKNAARTAELSHPEAYLRARALKLWSEQGVAAESEIARMIEGSVNLDELDLLGQRRLTEITRRVVARYFAPEVLRTEALLGHARLFFPDFTPSSLEMLPSVPPHESIQRYFSYLLLDFAVADPQLADVPLAAAILLSRDLGLEDRFLQLVGQELKMKKKGVESLRESAAAIVAKAAGA